MKTCSKCNAGKPLTAFYADKRKADGLCAQCKECRSAAHKTHKDANKDKIAGRERVWRENNRDRVLKNNSDRRNQKRAMCLVAAARVRARAKGVAFSLTDSDISQLQAVIDIGLCQLSGAKFTIGGPRSATSPSLDRITPALGYVSGNVRVICHALNAALGDWGEESLAPIMAGWLATRNAINAKAAQAFIESVM